MAMILVATDDGEATGTFLITTSENLQHRILAELPNIVRAVDDALLHEKTNS